MALLPMVIYADQPTTGVLGSTALCYCSDTSVLKIYMRKREHVSGTQSSLALEHVLHHMLLFALNEKYFCSSIFTSLPAMFYFNICSLLQTLYSHYILPLQPFLIPKLTPCSELFSAPALASWCKHVLHQHLLQTPELVLLIQLLPLL